MKHDEFCEVSWWIRHYPESWPQCGCAVRALERGEPIEPIIYPAESIFEQEDW